jgi:enoyl-CoA hydratase
MSIVEYEVRNHLAWITLNRPEKLNAISQDTVRELGLALTRAEADDAVKVVLLRGAGRAFSAGFDLGEESATPSTADGWHAILQNDVGITMRLWAFPKPTIAAVHGWVLAGGCDLAMACDMIVAADNANFGEPEVRYGSGPATLLMPFVLGQKKTNELLYTGDTINAVDAERFGLVNTVVPLEQLEEAATQLALRVATAPLVVLKLTKIALTRAYEAMGLREAVHANMDISAILNAAVSSEKTEFDELVKHQGLKAALAWRDERYGVTRSNPKKEEA